MQHMKLYIDSVPNIYASILYTSIAETSACLPLCCSVTVNHTKCLNVGEAISTVCHTYHQPWLYNVLFVVNSF